MFSFRFEYYENVVTKHHLKKVDWKQVAKAASKKNLNHKDVSIAGIRMLDEDTVEIIKRKDQNKGLLFQLGFDQRGQYERVIINRKDKSTAVDRIDVNWWQQAPFMGQRDLFFPDKRDPNLMTFVRHDYWQFTPLRMMVQGCSSFSFWQYKRAFKKEQ